MARILKIKEWIFDKKLKIKLEEYFKVFHRISPNRKKEIEDGYGKLMEKGKFNGREEEVLKTINDAMENIKADREIAKKTIETWKYKDS